MLTRRRGTFAAAKPSNQTIMNKRLEPWVVFGAGAGAAGLVAWAYGWFLAGLTYNFQSWRVIAADLLLKVVIPVAGGMAALARRRLARRSASSLGGAGGRAALAGGSRRSLSRPMESPGLSACPA